MIETKRALAVFAVVALASCGTLSSAAFPTAIVTPSGKRGFSQAGVSTAFTSEAEVRRDLGLQFTEACGGHYSILTEKFEPTTNGVGTPFVRFSMVVECET